MNRPTRNRRPPSRYGHHNTAAQSEPSSRIPVAGSSTMPRPRSPQSYDTDLPLAHWDPAIVPPPPASPENGVRNNTSNVLASRGIPPRGYNNLGTFDIGRPADPIPPTPIREAEDGSVVATPAPPPAQSEDMQEEVRSSENNNTNLPPVGDYHPHIPSSSDPGETPTTPTPSNRDAGSLRPNILRAVGRVTRNRTNLPPPPPSMDVDGWSGVLVYIDMSVQDQLAELKLTTLAAQQAEFQQRLLNKFNSKFIQLENKVNLHDSSLQETRDEILDIIDRALENNNPCRCTDCPPNDSTGNNNIPNANEGEGPPPLNETNTPLGGGDQDNLSMRYSIGQGRNVPVSRSTPTEPQNNRRNYNTNLNNNTVEPPPAQRAPVEGATDRSLEEREIVRQMEALREQFSFLQAKISASEANAEIKNKNKNTSKKKLHTKIKDEPDESDGSSSSSSSSSNNFSDSSKGSKKRRNKKIKNKNKYRKNHSSSSSSEEDDDEPIANYKTRMGPSYPGLQVLKTNDPRFKDLVNYKRYRLLDTNQSQGKRATNRTGKNIRKLKNAMTLPKFDGSVPLDIINYLGELKKKLNRNKIPEGEAFLLLPDFLTGEAKTDFEQSLDIGENDLEGIDSWPSAVQYFLQVLYQ